MNKKTKNTYADFQWFTKKMQKKCKNIWSVQKKAVPLHPLSLKNGVRPKERKAKMIFERLSIHNKIVVQELR